MTCDYARILSLFNRPGDLAEEDRAALATHLAGCPACTAASNTLTAQDSLIASAMKAVTLPVGFRDALQNKAIRVQADLAHRLWVFRAAGLAAAVVMGLIASSTYTIATRPTLDTDALLSDFERSGETTPTANVEGWLKAERLPRLPVDFNMNLVTFTGELSLQGRSLPAMRLQSGSNECTIYFVRNSRFHLANAEDSVGSSGTVRVYRDLPGGWTLIVLHTGNSLQPFLRASSAA
ncbi:hypothetical protein BH11PLA2_BH11PLA2_15200 [soil metagenome]